MGCPPELKILVSDKITAYYKYTTAHKQLFACTTLAESLRLSKEVVKNKIENDLIYRELDYYKKNKKILAEHSIFSYYKELKDLRLLNPGQLFRKYNNTVKECSRYLNKLKANKDPSKFISDSKHLERYTLLRADIERILENIGFKDVIQKK